MAVAHSPDGCRLYYEENGNPSAPAIFVGYPWNEGWIDVQYQMGGAEEEKQAAIQGSRNFVSMLARYFRVIHMDYPRGCGRSEGPRENDLQPETIAADYVTVADAAGVDRFFATGYSWSGVMAKQVVMRTDRCAGIICGGWPPLGGPYAQILEQVMQTNALLPEGQVRDVLMSNQRMYTALVAGFNEETAITGLQGRDLLLQCIYASEDLGVPEMGLPLPIRDAIRDNTARLQQLGWRIDEVSGYDHMTLPPETIAERIIDFLKDKSW